MRRDSSSVITFWCVSFFMGIIIYSPPHVVPLWEHLEIFFSHHLTSSLIYFWHIPYRTLCTSCAHILYWIMLWLPCCPLGAVLDPWRVSPSQPQGRHHARYPHFPMQTPDLALRPCSKSLPVPILLRYKSFYPLHLVGILNNQYLFPFLVY